MQETKDKIKASLAPMAGYTDVVFRRICSEMGAAYTVSEMISAVATTTEKPQISRESEKVKHRAFYRFSGMIPRQWRKRRTFC